MPLPALAAPVLAAGGTSLLAGAGLGSTAVPGLGALALGAGVGGSAAGGGGILATLGGLATDPVWGSLMAQMGTGLVNKFLGLGGAAPYEQANQARLDAAQSILPELQRAASALPTAGTDALMRQVRREGTAMQQSMAASARGSGVLGSRQQGGSIFRAQSDRVNAAQQEALAQRLGAYQTNAQQLLLGQLQPAIQTGNLFAQQDLKYEQDAMGAYGRLGRKYQENPNDEIVNRFIDVLTKLGVDVPAPGNGAARNTATPGLPALPTPARRSNFASQFRVPGLPAVGR